MALGLIPEQDAQGLASALERGNQLTVELGSFALAGGEIARELAAAGGALGIEIASAQAGAAAGGDADRLLLHEEPRH